MAPDNNITPPILNDDLECDETFDTPSKEPYSEADEHFWHDSNERARAAQWGADQ